MIKNWYTQICHKKILVSTQPQSSKLSGSPKPDACKIVHGRIKWVVPQARRACEKKSHIVSKVDFIRYCV